MVIKLWNISDWKKVEWDKLVVLHGRSDQSRKIRLEVNSRWPVRVELMREGDDPFHLATIQGMETIEFFVVGEARVSFAAATGPKENVEAWIYTKDGESTSVVIPEPEIFTQIAQRRARNPEMEWMQYQMMQNIERRLEQQAAQFARQFGANPETGEIEDEPETDGSGAGEGATEPAGDVSGGGQEPPPSDPEPADGASTTKTAQTSATQPASTGTA